MAMPLVVGGLITLSSRIEPPGWITAVAPASITTSRPSGTGRRHRTRPPSLWSTAPSASIPSRRRLPCGSPSEFSARPAWSASSSSRCSRTIRGSSSTWLGASERSEGKAYRDARRLAAASRLPDDVARRQTVEAARARHAPRSWCSPRSTPRSPARSSAPSPTRGPHRRQQRAQLPHGRRPCRCSSPRSTPIISRCSTRSAATRGWTGRIVTNPNCVDVVLRDGAGAAAAVRPDARRWSRRCRRFPARDIPACLVGHPRQRHSVHRRRRGREDRDRDAEDPRRAGRPARVDRAPGARQRDDDARAGARTATPARSRSALDAEAGAEAIIDALASVPRPAAGAGAAVRAAAADRVPRRGRTARSRARREPRRRDDGHASAACARVRCSTTSSSRSATTRFAARPAPRS